MYTNDNRIVMTLDAGGTNFVFSAIQGGKEIADPVVLPACADCLDKCLGNLVEGFKAIQAGLPETPVAISFAFPGPADDQARFWKIYSGYRYLSITTEACSRTERR